MYEKKINQSIVRNDSKLNDSVIYKDQDKPIRNTGNPNSRKLTVTSEGVKAGFQFEKRENTSHNTGKCKPMQ